MSTDARNRRTADARRLMGLEHPPSGWCGWLRDPHFLLCLAAAVPVWLAIGLISGAKPAHITLSYVVSLVLVQPAVEELVFRGAVQGVLLERGWARRRGPVSLANVATSALFAVAHLITQPAAWALAVFVPSLVFGHLRERTGSLLPAIALHALYNAGFLATLAGLH